MAEVVSKLYAEIGFKINQEGLKKAKEEIQKLSDQLSAINTVAKKQAETHGIYSKERTQKDIMRERIFKRMIKAKKNNLSWLDHQENKIAKEAEKREKEKVRAQEKAAKEQAKVDRQREQDTQKHNERMIKFATRGVRGMARVLRGSAKLFANATRTMWKSTILPSLSGAVNVRDFMMYSGTSLNKLQEIEERFASVGSSMRRDEMMSELSNAMQNLTQIRFAEGELGGYKLSGLQALAHKRDISGVLDALEKASVGTSNQDLSFLLDKIGLTGQKWLPYFRARRVVNKAIPRLGDEGQEQLVEAKGYIEALGLAARRSGDIITSKLSPIIERVTSRFIDFISTAISDENIEKLGGIIERLSDRFIKWLESIEAQDIEWLVDKFMNAIKSLAEGIEWLANEIGVLRSAKRAIDAARKGDTVGAVTNWIDSFLQSRGMVSPAITVYNNQRTDVSMEGVGDQYKDVIEKAVEIGVSKGTDTASNVGSYIWGVLSGVTTGGGR